MGCGEPSAGGISATVLNHILEAFLENLKENIFWYKSNVVGKRTWNKSLIAGYWDQNPFAAPFFIECIEIRE